MESKAVLTGGDMVCTLVLATCSVENLVCCFQKEFWKQSRACLGLKHVHSSGEGAGRGQAEEHSCS